MPNDPMITAQDVAGKLGVSIYTVHRLKSKPGGIPAYKVAGCVRFKSDEVDAYIAAQAVKPAVHEKPMAGIRRFKYVPGMKVV